MYKFETHCHTKESSACGEVPAKQLVELYLKKGFDGVVITDHFNLRNSSELMGSVTGEVTFVEQVERLFAGYRVAKEVAKDRLIVLAGLELRFDNNYNDYLVYGMEEHHLHDNPGIFGWGIEKFSGYARRQGFLVVQAHPFRNNMEIVNPNYIDMLEVYNGHPRQFSRNTIAVSWAELHNLPGSSGSDFHREGDEGKGGVLLNEGPQNMEHFINMMRRGPLLISRWKGE